MIESDRLVTPETTKAEYAQDWAIRPKTFDEYRGQPQVSEQMTIFIEAAKRRGESLDHTLIFGPPGLGKTTLANIIANEMGVQIKSTSGPVIEKKGDLVAALTNLEGGDVLFIDEIHRLTPAVEEILKVYFPSAGTRNLPSNTNPIACLREAGLRERNPSASFPSASCLMRSKSGSFLQVSR